MITNTPITGEVPIVRAPNRTTVPVENPNPARALALAGLRAPDRTTLYIIPAKN